MSRRTEERSNLMLERRLSSTSCLAVLAVSIAGCGGGGFGGQLAVRPEPMPLDAVAAKTITLPADAPFSIKLAPSEKSPGLDGKAEAGSETDADGSANASATVENGGSATAGFQLGHAFVNDAERQVDLSVGVRFDYEYQSEAADVAADTATPSGAVELTLFALDGRGRELRKFPILAHASEEGSAASSASKSMRFGLTLSPGQEVSIYLAGQVKAETDYGETAGGSLRLSNLQMQVSGKAAPPVRTAADEPE
jgi:hypothetical protein